MVFKLPESAIPEVAPWTVEQAISYDLPTRNRAKRDNVRIFP